MTAFAIGLPAEGSENDEFDWAWTGRKFVFLGVDKCDHLDMETGEWNAVEWIPIAKKDNDPKEKEIRPCFKMAATSQYSVGVAFHDGKEGMAIFNLDLRKNEWSSVCSFKTPEGWADIDLPRRRIAALNFNGKYWTLLLIPPPAKMNTVKAGETEIRIPGLPAAGPSGTRPRVPGVDAAIYFTDSTMFWWGYAGKSNPGYLWITDLDKWESLEKVPPADEDRPFGGPTPRAGFRHCFTGSDVYVFGGTLAWSSAIGIPGAHPGFCWSEKTRKWRLLPTKGAPASSSRPGVCWTGKEVFVFEGGKGGGLFNPEKWEWLAISSENSPDWAVDPICFWSGREAVLFSRDGSHGAAYNPAADTWRSVGGIPGK